jgi:hypothetical protein
MRSRSSLVTAGVMFALALSAWAAKKPDPLAGHWELNVKKTHYGGGAQKRTQETFTCLQQKNGVECSIHSTMEGGSKVDATFTALYDGSAARVTGLENVDEVRLERVSDTIASATFIYQGNYVYAYRATKSDDGKSLTVVSVDPVTRRRLKSVVVYDLMPEKK